MIALSCDHGGYELKEAIRKWLDDKGLEYKDFGTYAADEPIDYPLAGLKAAKAVASGECEKAILCCGTGIGISMAANKVKGVRAACCSDYYSAKYTRLHNDANALCLGGRVLGPGLACELVDVFLHTEFEGGRHARRVGQIMDIQDGKID